MTKQLVITNPLFSEIRPAGGFIEMSITLDLPSRFTLRKIHQRARRIPAFRMWVQEILSGYYGLQGLFAWPYGSLVQ